MFKVNSEKYNISASESLHVKNKLLDKFLKMRHKCPNDFYSTDSLS